MCPALIAFRQIVFLIGIRVFFKEESNQTKYNLELDNQNTGKLPNSLFFGKWRKLTFSFLYVWGWVGLVDPCRSVCDTGFMKKHFLVLGEQKSNLKASSDIPGRRTDEQHDLKCLWSQLFHSSSPIYTLLLIFFRTGVIYRLHNNNVFVKRIVNRYEFCWSQLCSHYLRRSTVFQHEIHLQH